MIPTGRMYRPLKPLALKILSDRKKILSILLTQIDKEVRFPGKTFWIIIGVLPPPNNLRRGHQDLTLPASSLPRTRGYP